MRARGPEARTSLALIASSVALAATRRRKNPNVDKFGLAQRSKEPVHGQAERGNNRVMKTILRNMSDADPAQGRSVALRRQSTTKGIHDLA